MRIDSSGRVTMPYQPACSVRLNGNTTSAGAYSTHTVRVNTGGHWNSSTHRFTAPVTGVYKIHWSGYTQYNSSWGWNTFYKNGSPLGLSWHWNHANTLNGHTMGAGHMLVSLNTNDYVQMGRGSATGNAHMDLVEFTVELIG